MKKLHHLIIFLIILLNIILPFCNVKGAIEEYTVQETQHYKNYYHKAIFSPFQYNLIEVYSDNLIIYTFANYNNLNAYVFNTSRNGVNNILFSYEFNIPNTEILYTFVNKINYSSFFVGAIFRNIPYYYFGLKIFTINLLTHEVEEKEEISLGSFGWNYIDNFNFAFFYANQKNIILFSYAFRGVGSTSWQNYRIFILLDKNGNFVKSLTIQWFNQDWVKRWENTYTLIGQYNVYEDNQFYYYDLIVVMLTKIYTLNLYSGERIEENVINYYMATLYHNKQTNEEVILDYEQYYNYVYEPIYPQNTFLIFDVSVSGITLGSSYYSFSPLLNYSGKQYIHNLIVGRYVFNQRLEQYSLSGQNGGIITAIDVNDNIHNHYCIVNGNKIAIWYYPIRPDLYSLHNTQINLKENEYLYMYYLLLTKQNETHTTFYINYPIPFNPITTTSSNTITNTNTPPQNEDILTKTINLFVNQNLFIILIVLSIFILLFYKIGGFMGSVIGLCIGIFILYYMGLMPFYILLLTIIVLAVLMFRGGGK